MDRMSWSVIRGYCFFGISEGRETGGNEGSIKGVTMPCVWVGGRSKGEEGAVVNDSGEGIVGGGRWMNVRLSSSWTFGISARGSGTLGGGLVGRRVE